MKTQEKDNLETDEFELIELGSVSEETKGIAVLGDEYLNGSFNSRE